MKGVPSNIANLRKKYIDPYIENGRARQLETDFSTILNRQGVCVVLKITMWFLLYLAVNQYNLR